MIPCAANNVTIIRTANPVKTWEICNHLEQINNIRGLLGDYDSPVGRIKRPKDMKLYLFRKRVAKLRQQESLAKRKLEQGLRKYMASAEKD